MSGPPSKSDRRRRNPTPGFRLLPHEGRKGRAPRWPLDGPRTDEEKKVWRELWKLPQAVEWERMAYTRTVARYVRTVIWAEKPGADSKLLAEARQLEDRLGVTPRAMLSLRWETDEPEPDADPEETVPAEQSTRRVTAIDPGVS